MSYAVSFALLSLVFAGGIDVLFKRYARKIRSRGVFLFVTGLVWSALQLIYFAYRGGTLSHDGATLLFGLAAGISVSLANLLLLESLSHLDVSQGSTIYRLNTIGVVILSAILLGEGLGPYKATGVCFGIASVLLLYRESARTTISAANIQLTLYIWIAVAASLFRALYGVITKAGLAQGGDAMSMIIISALCWMISGAGYAKFRESRVRLTWPKLAYATCAGVLVFLVVNTLVEAISYGEVSIVVPIANLSFVVALLISAVLRMETVTKYKVSAMGLAMVAIVLLSHAA
jgi:drug/metabolite transporter (DMT)-like permease